MPYIFLSICSIGAALIGFDEFGILGGIVFFIGGTLIGLAILGVGYSLWGAIEGEKKYRKNNPD